MERTARGLTSQLIMGLSISGGTLIAMTEGRYDSLGGGYLRAGQIKTQLVVECAANVISAVTMYGRKATAGTGSSDVYKINMLASRIQ